MSEILTYIKEYDKIERALYTQVVLKYNGESFPVIALWDTGAMASAIPEQVAIKMGMEHTKQSMLHTTAASYLSYEYHVDVRIGDQIVFPDLRVVSCKYGGGNFDFVIGMDIIQCGNFSIDNTSGKTILTYKIAVDEEI